MGYNRGGSILFYPLHRDGPDVYLCPAAKSSSWELNGVGYLGLDGGVTSHIILRQKQKCCQEDTEVKVYEKIIGLICSYNVSCDFYVDWLQSITGAAETSGSSGTGNGSVWST